MRKWMTSLSWVFLACAGWVPARGQDVQFLPELDAHLKVTPTFRTYVQGKGEREADEQLQFSVGPSVQFYSRPLLKLRDVTLFDLDDMKKRPFVLETGYRYLTAPGEPTTNRMETIATAHYPMRAGFLLVDRNRADLDWKGGAFQWRYRNKVTIQRTFTIGSYHPIPYVAVEPYYVSKYGKWSTTALYAGFLFPLGRHVQFNTYYEHQNNTGKSPNKQVNQVGLALNLYFSIEK
jgi:hypothetical protein